MRNGRLLAESSPQKLMMNYAQQVVSVVNIFLVVLII